MSSLATDLAVYAKILGSFSKGLKESLGTVFFTDRMPFQRPNKWCQSTEVKNEYELRNIQLLKFD